MNTQCRDSEAAGVLTEVSLNNTINNPAHANIHVDRVAVKIVWDQQSDLDFDGLLNIAPDLFDGEDIRGFVLLNGKKDFRPLLKG